VTGPAGAEAFLARVDDVQRRLAAHARSEPAPGLTAPDPPTGEQWDWGQVWAHLGEFVPYWTGQVRMVLALPSPEDPVPFGRTKTDPVRVGAIEADRHTDPSIIMGRLVKQLDDLGFLLAGMTPEGWSRTVLHSTLGVMNMQSVIDEFLVGHLEAHAVQLDGLVAADSGGHEPSPDVP